MRTRGSRTRTFLVAGAVLMLLVTAIAALVVARTMASITRTDAQQRGAHGVDLLVTVGPDFPNLTSAALARGLTPAAGQLLDNVVARVQRERLLADLIIWDRSGRIVYSSVDAAEGTRPPIETELVTALSGRSTTRTHTREIDPSSGKPTGVLDVFEPLTDARGAVYGAVEASLPLKPIDQAASRSHRQGVLFVIGAAAIVWLLLLPLWLRLARSQAKDWTPGHRRTLRAFRRALDRDEIELVYQPQIEPGSRRVDGVEALVRWRRNGDLITPDRFLPVVETSALMPRLTDRVLDLALAQLARWRRRGIRMRLSVNLSSTDLADKSLPQRIAAKLDLHGVLGQSLTVEVTETAILDHPEQARLLLTTLDQMGIDIAVDDFGTGHASISRLHGLPVSEVKIDRSFVSDTQERSRTYMAAMVAFGHNLGLRVVAEGVEDEETLAILTTLKCDLAQGYLIARPLDPVAMTRWLTTTDVAAAVPMQPAAARTPVPVV